MGFRAAEWENTEGQLMVRHRQKRAVALAGLIIFFFVLWGISACSPDKLYYEDRLNPVTDIINTFGPPQWVKVQPDGAEKLIYRVHDSMGGNDYHRYFIIKDGKVIGGGIE